MPLKIHNSLTKQKEEFKPLDPLGKEVKMYVCGPTVYDEPHIGHLRSAYVFDVMRRYLEYSGYHVKFVRNVTDVDDKIIDKARESDPSDLLAEVRKVSEKYLGLYKTDLQAMGIDEPTVEPKATGHIQEMQNLIQKLIEGKKAYVSGGDVYFDVNGFGGYGKLSHQNKEAILQNGRIDKNEKKHEVLDFALWKNVKADEPSWPSPWGDGRPGWHIECSAMSMKYLGESLDIHGGGRDLIFPHHENEVAQSESVTGACFAKYWVHHGLITVNEQKMSKSLKNYITLTQVSAMGPSAVEELKFLFLGTHYSAPLDYSQDKMKMEKSIRERFFYFFREADEHAEKFQNVNAGGVKLSVDFEAAFREAMDDDFNTPKVISLMHEMVDHARRVNDHESIGVALLLRRIGGILGLFSVASGAGETDELKAFVQEQIARREEAKTNKNYKLADRIREDLSKKGISLMDTPSGVKWVKT